MSDDERYCQLWDQCTCGHQWRRWNYIDENPDEWLPDEFVIMCCELEIMNLLDCVSRRCPDPAFRKHAKAQLKHPRFTLRGRLDA
jgi:hypothetical protein